MDVRFCQESFEDGVGGVESSTVEEVIRCQPARITMGSVDLPPCLANVGEY